MISLFLPSARQNDSPLPSLLTRLHGTTELHNDPMGANGDHESVMTFVNLHSYAQMIYLIIRDCTHALRVLSRSLSFPTATGG